MTILKRLWGSVDDEPYGITLLKRPRVSYKVDDYVWNMIEENIVKPNKIMQSERYDYVFVVAFTQYNPEKFRFAKVTPYNGVLKDNVMQLSNQHPKVRYAVNDFVNGEFRKKWFTPEKFWINSGKKTALVSVTADIITEKITPLEYADILFDAFAATLLYNFKKLNLSDFEKLKTYMKADAICSFPFPALFDEQRYINDGGSYCHFTYEDGMKKKSEEITSIEQFYKQYYMEE